MEYLVRHMLSQKAAEDLVELLTAHFPQGHKLCTSLYRLKSFWRKQSNLSGYDKTVVCSSCDSILQEGEKQCGRPECLEISLPPVEFLQLNIETALGQLLHGRHNIGPHLSTRPRR